MRQNEPILESGPKMISIASRSREVSAESSVFAFFATRRGAKFAAQENNEGDENVSCRGTRLTSDNELRLH